MRFLPLTACALLFALPAKADKFWLTDPESRKNATEGSSPEVIDGVLLAEEGDTYRIRIVGGEVVLPKKAVFKIEKDGLTVDNIVKLEQDAATASAKVNSERELQRDIARRERELRAAEAAAKKSERKAADASASARPSKVADEGFDPVIDRATVVSSAELERQTRLLYEATGDRAYLRALRQLRRLR